MVNSKAYFHLLHTHITSVACSIHVAIILYVCILNVLHYKREEIPSAVAVSGEGGVAGERRVVGGVINTHLCCVSEPL